MPAPNSLNERLTAWLPPALAAGCALFAWSLTGALDRGAPVRAALALAAAAGLMAVWLAESAMLSRALKAPLAGIKRQVAVSLIPFIVFPLSSPYFSQDVYSSFLKGDPSPKRLAVLTAWLLLLAVCGSFLIKLALLWRRTDTILKALERSAVKIQWAGVVLYFLVFVALAFLAYDQFRFHSDLGQYNQTLWATLRGHPYYSSVEETSGSFLSTHVSPFLLLILPVYAIYQSPLTYLFLRSLALSLAAIPLFYCVRRITGSGVAGLLLSVAFLFNPEIVSQHFTSGYEVVFVAVFFFAAYYFLQQRRFGLFITCLVMVVMVREDFIPAALIFALYNLIKRMPLKWILTPLAIWMVWQVSAALIVYATTENNVFRLYFGNFGDTPFELAKTMITHPVYAIQEIWSLQKSYLYNLLMPVGFILPLTSLISIFAIPNVAAVLVRSHDVTIASGGVSHYSVLVVAALWLGLAGFAARIQKKAKDDSKGKTAVLFAIIILVLVGSVAHLWAYYLPTGKPKDADALEAAIDLMPADASIASNDGRVFPRLSSRWYLYEPLVWDVLQEPERMPQGTAQLRKADYVILKPFGSTLYNDQGAFDFVTAPDSPYKMIFEQDGIRVFKVED